MKFIFLYIYSSDDMMNTVSTPVIRTALADSVADGIKDLIKSQKYQPGDKLPSETELMKMFSVGRSSIREAMRILANCGLVNIKQGIGTFVELNEGIHEPLHHRLKRAGNKDLQEVRQLLELKAAEKAAANRTQKDISRLSSLLKKRNLAIDNQLVEECIDADVQFHIAIAEAGKNEILADLYKTIAVQIKKSFTNSYADTSVFRNKQQLHEDLLQSIVDKNAERAWKCVAQITGQNTPF